MPKYSSAPRMSLAAVAILVLATGGSATAVEREVDLGVASDIFVVREADVHDRLGVRSESCDINGDGLSDLILGADLGDGPGNTRGTSGEVYVFLGRRGAWTGTHDVGDVADTTIYGQDNFDSLGMTVMCGDVNGDGFADALLGARQADGPNNSRAEAGQIHIVLGRTDMPATIDLASESATVIWGAEPEHTIGGTFAVGDIDGDSLADLIMGTGDGKDRGNTVLYAGRVYVLFGRTSWPTSIDLATGADMVIYGATNRDFLGESSGAADLDGDGIAELVAVAPQGDGPLDKRTNAGELHVWRGRLAWPTEIDLAIENADMLVYGPDVGDMMVDTGKDLRFGDIDADGSAEIVAGAFLAQGPMNDAYGTGEGLVYEPGSVFPPEVDLAIDRDAVVYGRQIDDQLCNSMRVGDVNGDATDDFLCGASKGDGPQDSRTQGGEVYVIYGHSAFPQTIDLGVESADLIVYGRGADDRENLVGLADLNADGLLELVTTARDNAAHPYLVSLVSPYDIDGDGLTQLADNCPLVANPLQEDSGGDLVGDACAGDYDGDGEPDESDCAPNNAAGGKPQAVTGVVWEAASTETLIWQAEGFSNTYDLTRGKLSELGPGSYGECVTASDPDPSDTRFDDSEFPLAGEGFNYLIRGRNATCNLVGSWGMNSAGAERQNSDPDACH